MHGVSYQSPLHEFPHHGTLHSGHGRVTLARNDTISGGIWRKVDADGNVGTDLQKHVPATVWQDSKEDKRVSIHYDMAM